MLKRELAYETFTECLLAQDIMPGQIISQRELVEMTGMTLAAIREMIPRLEADGLICTVPKRGLQIAHVDLNLIRNAFQLRTVLEREAVTNFIHVAGREDVTTLRDEHLAVKNAAEHTISDSLIEQAQHLDWRMHDELIDRLGNELISNIYRVNSIKIRLIRQQDTRILPDLVGSVMDEHLAILDAVLQRDENAAVNAMINHIDSAKNRAIRL